MHRNIVVLIAAVGLVAAASDARAQARAEFVPSLSFSSTYDDNIFTTQQASGDAMMLVTPALEGFYESPTTTLQGLYTFDMQKAVGHPVLDSLHARRHGMFNTGFQFNPQFRLSLTGRYDVTETPGDLMLETGVLLGRRRASRYQLTPSIAYRIRPRTTLTAQYDGTKEALADDIRGDMYIARVGVSRLLTPRDTLSVNYLGRTFINGSVTEDSNALLLGYTRALAPGLSLSLQGGPRISSYGNQSPEILAALSRQAPYTKFGLDYWQGETIILGIRGPVAIESATAKASRVLRRNFEVGAHAGIFHSKTISNGEARVFHPEVVASYSPGGPYILAASYGVDFQRGDVRSQFLSDKHVVRHVFLFRLTFAPRLSQSIKPSDPNDPRSPKGVSR
jgi:hypothetical protein